MFKITTSFAALVLGALTLTPASLAEKHTPVWRRNHQAIARSNEYNVTESLEARAPGSRWTWYNTETGNAGSCGRFLKNSQFVVARAAVDMNQKRDCGKSITLSYQGRTAVATIEDTCPECPPNALDLSRDLFKFIAPKGDGVVYGDWWFNDGGAPPNTQTSTRTTTTKTSTSTSTRTSTRTTTTRTSSSTSATPTTTRTRTTTRTSSSTPTPTPTPTETETETTTSTSSTSSAARASASTTVIRKCGRRKTGPTPAAA